MLGDTYRKIKWGGKSVSLVWETQKTSDSQPTVHTLQCPDAPAPEFVEALQGLKPFVRSVCELPELWMKGLQVVGVSVTESEDGETRAVVTAAKPLANLDAPMILNTPAAIIAGDDFDRLDAIGFAADQYRNGVRAQGDLFKEEVGAALSFTKTGENSYDMHDARERVAQ